MRLLILFISFLISQVADSQIISASPPYRVRASGCATKLLDAYSGALAAYSLRLLDIDYAGSAIRVRRSSDNAEQDIGFTGTCGDLDTAALKTFVGTGGTDDGYIAIWYDQSGNNKLISTATGTVQPKIMDNGVVYRLNSKPAVRFDGDQRLYSAGLTSITGDYTFFAAMSAETQTSYRGFYSLGTTTANGFCAFTRLSTAQWGSFDGANRTANTDIQDDGMVLLSMQGTVNSSGTFYLNTASDGTYANSTGQGYSGIGGLQSAGQAFKGYMSEFILYNSTQSMSGVNSNINTYYSIY